MVISQNTQVPTSVIKFLLETFYLQGENISEIRTKGIDEKSASIYTEV